MMLTIMRGVVIAVAAIAALPMSAVKAQQVAPREPVGAMEPRRGETVTERARPDLDPLGVRAGSFIFLPRLSLGEQYDDNVFSTENNTEDDFITIISPELAVRSDWNNHLLAFNARSDIGRYASNGDEDYEDYMISANGRLDILRDRYLSAGIGYRQLHEDRGSPDDVNGVTPTEYTVLLPTLGFFNRWNRFSLNADLAMEQLDFDDVQSSTGATINNDDRDRARYVATLRGGYEIVPEYEAFVRVAWNTVRYDDERDDAGFVRDSDGYEAVVGTRIDLTGVTYGDVYVGWRSQSYDDDRLETAQGPSFGGAITWNVTGLTTVKGSVARSVEETTQQTASGFMATDVRLSVDHELLRNLLIGANAGYILNDYEGITREDDIYRAGAYARYLMHRNLYLTARYNYEKRDSNVAGADYDKNVILLRLETQL